MSRSNDTQIKNPSTKFFEWNGDKGGFKYYDKDKKDEPSKGQIQVPFPFRFLVLDELTTIRGFSDADQCGFYSNEIRDTRKEPLTVKNRKGFLFTGLYEQVKEKCGSKGADYAKSLYIAYYDENKKLVIGNITLKGASIGPWIEFCKENKVMEIGVQCKSMIEGKKGKTVYQMPVFEVLPVSEETNKAAIELDIELQAHLKAYFSRTPETITPEPIQEKQKAEQEQPQQKRTEVAATTSDDNDDLPF